MMDCRQGGCCTSHGIRTANSLRSAASFRTYIAALHYNCNADRKVRLTEDGEDKHALKFSRARKQWTVVPVMEDTKFGMLSSQTMCKHKL